MQRVILFWLAVSATLPDASAFSGLLQQTSCHTLATRSQIKMVYDVNDALLHSSAILDGVYHASHHAGGLQSLLDPSPSADLYSSLTLSDAAVSAYSKVDKTGFIGFFATYIEIAIDFGRELFQKMGIQNAYGYSIILFTLFIKAITLPLTTSQLESTTKMQQLQPMQKKIQEKYADDEQTRNQLLSQLFQAAQVNPLAGCLPALVQIPVFISLYRALTNLVAEDKLGEPFLWIPDLEGPVYAKPPGESAEWIKSIFTGNPVLGWHDTLAFLSLPLLLYVGQTVSQKALQPPKDPNKVMTEQEQFSQGLVNNLPIIVAFFSINVPAGLALYWVVNNLLTTIVTLVVKSSMKSQAFPMEVEQMMALVDGSGSSTGGARKGAPAPSALEMGRGASVVDSTGTSGTKVEGFGSGQSPWTTPTAANQPDTNEAVDAVVIPTEGKAKGGTVPSNAASEVAAVDASVAESAPAAPKRKKRTKPAQKGKKGKA